MANPMEIKPDGAFLETLGEERRTLIAAPQSNAKAANTFQVALYNQGVMLGWLGQNSSGWAILVNDASQALTLEQYPYNGVTYYRISGSDSYMSVSNQDYIGFYNWLGATGFTLQGTNLVSDYNGQKLSLYSTDNAYLYAWDKYTVLDVKFQ